MKIPIKEREWFCPQINGMCRHDCYCYHGPIIFKNSKGVKELSEAYCGHISHQGYVDINIL